MKDINVIAEFPEVLGAVLSDASGALLDALGDVDGESAGAVHAYSLRALSQAGELLGLGGFERVTVLGPGQACVIALQGDAVLGVYVDPAKPLAPFEKKLLDALQQ
jgi:hypothetical protein